MKIVRYAGAVVAAIVLTVAAVNYFSVSQRVGDAIAADARNEGITVWGHFDNYVDTSILVVDLRSVSDHSSRADVFRALVQTAERLKESSFQTVILSYRGTPKFTIEGSYFRTLGQEYGTQNPVYTMRTFSENVYRLNGTKAYPEWTGGFLGVMTKQMEQFTQFHDDWYLNDLGHR